MIIPKKIEKILSDPNLTLADKDAAIIEYVDSLVTKRLRPHIIEVLNIMKKDDIITRATELPITFGDKLRSLGEEKIQETHQPKSNKL